MPEASLLPAWPQLDDPGYRAAVALLHRAVLCPALPETDVGDRPRPRDPSPRAAPADPAHHDDPSAGDHELPRLPRRTLHRHRGFRTGPARDTAHTAGDADRH